MDTEIETEMSNGISKVFFSLHFGYKMDRVAGVHFFSQMFRGICMS